MTPLLDVQDLKTYFAVRRGGFLTAKRATLKAVDGVSFQVAPREVLGLVGESGCGKSTLARTLVRLVEPVSGTVRLNGDDITALSSRQMRPYRTRMQMIFQDPYASLNPRMTVFDAIAEPLRVHGLATSAELPERVGALMEQVGLARRAMRKYPHEFSGGQRQRVAIARALATKPELIIADEPVSALDVSVQAQILNLLMRLCRENDLTMIFISHDLGVVRHVADRIAVMYLGRIVELGPAEAIFERPRHPYTQALLSAIPLLGEQVARPIQLQGDPPSPIDPPAGCAFHTRCPYAEPRCGAVRPVLEAGELPAHQTACVRQHELDLSATHA
jgi:oligopeptide/dipeptide ABC transporter ATP-binding protein